MESTIITEKTTMIMLEIFILGASWGVLEFELDLGVIFFAGILFYLSSKCYILPCFLQAISMAS